MGMTGFQRLHLKINLEPAQISTGILSHPFFFPGQLIHSFLTCSVISISEVWMRFGSWFSSTCSMPIALLEIMLSFLDACVSTQIPTQDYGTGEKSEW